VIESTGLSIGDVILDDKGNCWIVNDTTSSPVTVTFSSYYGTDCNDCIANNGCFWYVECCPDAFFNGIINDYSLPPFTPGDVIKCSDEFCYTVITTVLGPATLGAVQWFPNCDECAGNGGIQCK
jgi:hypothetical protein